MSAKQKKSAFAVISSVGSSFEHNHVGQISCCRLDGASFFAVGFDFYTEFYLFRNGEFIRRTHAISGVRNPTILGSGKYAVYDESRLIIFDNLLEIFERFHGGEDLVREKLYSYGEIFYKDVISVSGSKYTHVSGGLYFNQRNLISIASFQPVKILSPYNLSANRVNSKYSASILYHLESKSRSFTAYSVANGINIWQVQNIFEPYKGMQKYNYNDVVEVYDVNENANEVVLGVSLSKTRHQVWIIRCSDGNILFSCELKSKNLLPVYLGDRTFLVSEDFNFKALKVVLSDSN